MINNTKRKRLNITIMRDFFNEESVLDEGVLTSLNNRYGTYLKKTIIDCLDYVSVNIANLSLAELFFESFFSILYMKRNESYLMDTKESDIIYSVFINYFKYYPHENTPLPLNEVMLEKFVDLLIQRIVILYMDNKLSNNEFLFAYMGIMRGYLNGKEKRV